MLFEYKHNVKKRTGNQPHYAVTIFSTQDSFCIFWRATVQSEETNLSFVCVHNTDQG